VARRSRGGFPVRTNLRRATSWDTGAGGTTPTVVSSGIAQFVGSAAAATTDGLTIVRTRGHLAMFLESVTSAMDSLTGAFGIGIATSAAIAAGIASVPTPLTEQAWEGWMYWSSFTILGRTAVEADGVNDSAGVIREVIDSKAMRKINSDMSIYAAIETVEVGAANMDVYFDSRVLSKLP